VFRNPILPLLAASAAALLSGPAAQAAHFRVLHVFEDGSDGATSNAPVIVDASGDIFGTALQGGANNYGVVFEIAADGTESILYSFAGGNDGNKPEAGLLEDAGGNLYGTTYFGGPDDKGTAFKLAPDGSETVLHAFAGGDGGNPQASLIADASGNLYGTTTEGGGAGCDGTGCGVIFEIAANGAFTVLHSFAGASDGAYPMAQLTADGKGNLYGTGAGGGEHGDGTVFKLTPGGKLKVLHAFAGGGDGLGPQAGLIMDGAGDFYGTTRNGGHATARLCSTIGCGTIFRLAPDGKETVLYAFSGNSDGAEPYGGVVADGSGNLYGTTIAGGGADGLGVVFKLSPRGKETALHAFAGEPDGAWPEAGVVFGAKDRLIGTAYAEGPDGWGTVFAVAP
jgi:uncharacterized repeat protein (TIGR03803 family)